MSCVIDNNKYILSKTIASKSNWCKSNGGTWLATDKVWVFPITLFDSCRDVESKYKKASYNVGSKADYYSKQRQQLAASKKHYKCIQDQLERWKIDLRPGISPEGNEIIVNYSSTLQFIGYKTDPNITKLEAIQMPCCKHVLIRYSNGGVFVYSGGYD